MTKHDGKFYVTTPIYYVNSRPHVGTSYTTIIADVTARWHRLRGEQALLTTGSDEHSQNIADLAAAAGKHPRAFCDEMIVTFLDCWKLIDIQSYHFERTSDQKHHELTRTFWQRIFDNGDVYKGTYSGWYHTSDNRFLDDDEVPENPEGHPRLKYLTEEAYYFRLSKYQDWLLSFHEARAQFVIPDFRRNEMLNRIRAGLKDICISRTSTEWGIPLPWDDGHVFYVWIEALLAYVTGSGFDIQAFERTFTGGKSTEVREPLWNTTRADLKSQPPANFWPCDLHTMACDITWFHTVIWPAMCQSYGLPLPRQVLVHGYWNFAGEKMSKSVGNVVDPRDAVSLVGVDGLRYFLLREVPLGGDGGFNHEALVGRFNFDLANDLGNLVHRSVSMLHQLFDGVVPEVLGVTAADDEIEQQRREKTAEVCALMDELRYSEALQAIWELVRLANRYIDDKKPWELKKRPERRDELSTVFSRLVNVIRTVLLLGYPVIPGAANRMWRMLGLPGTLEEQRLDALEAIVPAGHKVGVSEPVFQRIDTAKLFAPGEAAQAEAAPPAHLVSAAGGSSAPRCDRGTEVPPTIAAPAHQTAAAPVSYDDFARLDLRVAEVRKAEKVAGADKLLALTVFDGERERQIVAGIAQRYSAEEMVGKRIVLLANLAPRKLRGLLSEGMLLAATSAGGELTLLTPEGPIAPGSSVS
jgi:methionyl-tRNA synthetase